MLFPSKLAQMDRQRRQLTFIIIIIASQQRMEKKWFVPSSPGSTEINRIKRMSSFWLDFFLPVFARHDRVVPIPPPFSLLQLFSFLTDLFYYITRHTQKNLIGGTAWDKRFKQKMQSRWLANRLNGIKVHSLVVEPLKNKKTKKLDNKNKDRVFWWMNLIFQPDDNDDDIVLKFRGEIRLLSFHLLSPLFHME